MSSPPLVSSLFDWKIIFFGQTISLALACCTAASSTLQAMKGFTNMPLFQISFCYLFLGFHVFFMDRSRKNGEVVDDSNHSNQNEWKGVSTLTDETTSLLEDRGESKGSSLSSSSIGETSMHRSLHAEISEKVERGEADCDNESPQGLDISSLGLRLHSPWYFYALIAFLDVQANYFVVVSFRYTTLINSNILTSLSITSVMATSYILLGRLIRWHHFAGACCCVLGASMIVSSDFYTSSAEVIDVGPALSPVPNNSTSSLRTLGDILAIVSAMLFGLNDALAELSIKCSTEHEYLAMMGIFGFVFSFVQSMVLERDQVSEFVESVKEFILCHYKRGVDIGSDEIEVDSMNNLSTCSHDVNFALIFLVWIWYIICLVYFYSAASRFLAMADATLLSLSLQSANFYTLLFSIVVQQMTPKAIYFAAAAIMIFGVWLYERGDIILTILSPLKLLLTKILDFLEGNKGNSHY
uniref:EamA domain-containing protein n=1 Tax=Chaetoceros debilis TaxID=122233 RepID=A0A7S3VBF8_9STRA|mmetsp:Transcript_6162/g.9052  ORF Transcript_6162/g.9052 Transcript_6162/m.9052 type:complete len:469 (-) Transcript_6162:368-1774(-)